MRTTYIVYFVIKKIVGHLRVYFWGLFCKIGHNSLFEHGVKLARPRNIEIGNGVRIAQRVYIEGGAKKIKIGNGVLIGRDCILIGGLGNLTIGSNSSLNVECYVGSDGEVVIGNYVMIGPKCNLITAKHGYNDWSVPMCKQKDSYGPIVLEDDVWLGINVTVLAGVRIGRGSIVGANSVVTKNVEPFSIVGGVPAKFIKYRFSEAEIKKAQEIIFSENNNNYVFTSR